LIQYPRRSDRYQYSNLQPHWRQTRVGFAIPIDMARKCDGSLKEHGRVVRGWSASCEGIHSEVYRRPRASRSGCPKHEGALVASRRQGRTREESRNRARTYSAQLQLASGEREHELAALVRADADQSKVHVEVMRNGKRIQSRAGGFPRGRAQGTAMGRQRTRSRAATGNAKLEIYTGNDQQITSRRTRESLTGASRTEVRQ